MRRLVISVLVSIFVLASSAFAADYVSGFTIDRSIVGGSTDRANATVTVARDPNSTGPESIQFGLPAGVTVICPPGTESQYGGYCYMPAGESTFTYWLVAGFTSSPNTVNVSARVSGNPSDPGVTAQLTVEPMVASVSVSPSSITGGGLEVAAVHVTVNATPASSAGVNLSTSVYLGSFSPGGAPPTWVNIMAGSTSTDTDFVPGTVSSTQTTTITPSVSNYAGSTANLTVNPGTPPRGTRMGHCVECEAAAGPIDLVSGNTLAQQQDYSLPGLGGLALTRSWNSLWTLNSPPQTAGLFGHSWTSNLEDHIQVVNPTTTIYWKGDGRMIQYAYDSMNQIYVLVSPPEEHTALTYDPIL